MQTFKDSQDRQWAIDLTFGAVRRVKAESEGAFDLLNPNHKSGEISQLDIVDGFDHLELFWELLWHLVSPQAKTLDITADAFADSIGPEELLNARSAFVSEWRDFFLKLQRADAATALEKTAKYHAKARQLMTLKLAQAMEGVDERMEKAMEKSLNNASGKLQESLNAILMDTPGGNSP